jgi:3-hydroxyacyl-CoA dehydrogenase
VCPAEAVWRAPPGSLRHVASRFQDALWRKLFHLVQSGVTSVKDIDTATSYGPGVPEYTALPLPAEMR